MENPCRYEPISSAEPGHQGPFLQFAIDHRLDVAVDRWRHRWLAQ